MYIKNRSIHFLASIMTVLHVISLSHATTFTDDLEAATRQTSKITMQSESIERPSSVIMQPTEISQRSTIQLFTRQTAPENVIISDIERGLEHKDDSEEFFSIVNQESNSEFATPCLETYTGCSFFCWNCLNISLEDLEVAAHGISTILAASAEFMSENWKMQFVVYSIQALMLANLFHKIYSLSEKMIVIKGKKKIELQKRNIINAQHDADEQSPILINGIDASKNTTIYATQSLANCFSCCAVARNILWDQVAVWSTLCQCVSGSILNFSQTVSSSSRSNYILIGTLFGVAGTILHTYAKLLKRKTKEAETLAINALKSVKHKQRMRNLDSRAANNL